MKHRGSPLTNTTPAYREPTIPPRPATRDTDSPRRIQRKRTKGWRMPEGGAYVGRPTSWGNPYRKGASYFDGSTTDSWNIVDLFREECQRRAGRDYVGYLEWIEPLRGRDLVCWCPLDEPCHADVLLELANR